MGYNPFPFLGFGFMRNGHSSPILTPPGAQAARVYGQIPATRGGSLTFSVCFTLLYLWASVGHAFAWWARVLCLGFYVVWAVLAYGSKRNTAYLAQQEEILIISAPLLHSFRIGQALVFL